MFQVLFFDHTVILVGSQIKDASNGGNWMIFALFVWVSRYFFIEILKEREH